MRGNDYQQRALRTMADQNVILLEMTTQKVQLDGGLRGLMDEVGELASCIKKHIEYGQPLNKTNLLEESGDALWRIAQILDAVGMTVEQAMESNIAKLAQRYPDKFSNEQAANENRNLEQEADAVKKFLAVETGVG